MPKNYHSRILHFLDETLGPVDVEKIRKNCRIANWNTALKNCLELLVQGKIKGEQTSKGWIFWLHQPTYLQPWEEVIGEYTKTTTNKDNITITLTIQKKLHVTFPNNTPEAQTILKTLQNTPPGTKIALLRTDNPEKPIIIKNLNETPESYKNFCTSFLMRSSLILVALKLVRSILCYGIWDCVKNG